MRAGVVRAEGQITTSISTNDRILIQQKQSSGQFLPREVTYNTLLSGGGTGTGARMGSATLVAGTVTVSNITVTAATKIFLTRGSAGASTAVGTLSVGTVTASASFIINSLNPTNATVQTNDISVINWILLEP